VTPFETIDADGVGRLVKIAAEEGRKTKPGLKLGVCGEHGGDPESVHWIMCSVRRSACRSRGLKRAEPPSADAGNIGAAASGATSLGRVLACRSEPRHSPPRRFPAFYRKSALLDAVT